METEVMTSQTSEESTATESDDSLMFDEVGSEQASEEPTEATEEQASETPAEPFLRIKYNGQEEDLTAEQAKELAEKGRNYDKVKQQRDMLQNDPMRKTIESLAKSAGMEVNDYVARLGQLQERTRINQIAQQFRAEHPGADDSTALDYAKQAYQNQQIAEQQEREAYEQQAANIRKEKAQAEVAAFAQEYPDVDLFNLPADVIERINQGESLMSAYHAYENKQLKAEMAALRKNANNKRKAVGSVAKNSASDTGGDPFLAGLLG